MVTSTFNIKARSEQYFSEMYISKLWSNFHKWSTEQKNNNTRGSSFRFATDVNENKTLHKAVCMQVSSDDINAYVRLQSNSL